MGFEPTGPFRGPQPFQGCAIGLSATSPCFLPSRSRRSVLSHHPSTTYVVLPGFDSGSLVPQPVPSASSVNENCLCCCGIVVVRATRWCFQACTGGWDKLPVHLISDRAMSPALCSAELPQDELGLYHTDELQRLGSLHSRLSTVIVVA